MLRIQQGPGLESRPHLTLSIRIKQNNLQIGLTQSQLSILLTPTLGQDFSDIYYSNSEEKETKNNKEICFYLFVSWSMNGKIKFIIGFKYCELFQVLYCNLQTFSERYNLRLLILLPRISNCSKIRIWLKHLKPWKMNSYLFPIFSTNMNEKKNIRKLEEIYLGHLFLFQILC